MKISEIIERGFKVNKFGKVIDDAGNEYRNEEGQVCYIKDDMTKKENQKWFEKLVIEEIIS